MSAQAGHAAEIATKSWFGGSLKTLLKKTMRGFDALGKFGADLYKRMTTDDWWKIKTVYPYGPDRGTDKSDALGTPSVFLEDLQDQILDTDDRRRQWSLYVPTGNTDLQEYFKRVQHEEAGIRRGKGVRGFDELRMWQPGGDDGADGLLCSDLLHARTLKGLSAAAHARRGTPLDLTHAHHRLALRVCE